MAADAIDAAAEDLGRRLQPSVTEHVPLVGADGYHALVNQVTELGQRAGLAPWRIRHLLDRYGSLLTEVLAPAEDDPRLLEPMPGAGDYLRAEIRYGATHEGALHLDDLLARRTRLSIEYGHRGVQSARTAAELVADVLGWDAAQVEAELDTYIRRVEAERASQGMATDEEADEARRAAPDSRARLVGPRRGART
jgi:glycerol-3-phosphate dehydrogenase